MVSKNFRGKPVLRINPKNAISPFYREIIVYPQRQLIKKNVAIRAKAKDIFRHIFRRRRVIRSQEFLDAEPPNFEAGSYTANHRAEIPRAESAKSRDFWAYRWCRPLESNPAFILLMK
jgi:hypothetical protein